MHAANFCAECGAPLKRKGLRGWLKGKLCDNCARRLGTTNLARPLLVLAIIAAVAFALGRYLRPAPPPLVIQRAANSPLSDLPVNFSDQPKAPKSRNETSQGADSQNPNAAPADDVVYICGARTKKGTPCHRRVHFAGERCYQHKGMPAMLPVEKLTVKS